MERIPGIDPTVVLQVRVQGILNRRQLSCIEGMSFESETAGDGGPVTVLTGNGLDLSTLGPILARIRNLNLRLLSLVRVEPSHDARCPRGVA